MIGPGPDSKILDSQPCFFMGVCEARNDPLKLGRVKVRVFGLHTDDLAICSADDLPWATCLIPTTEAGPAGIGTTRSGIPPGTWVFGLFLDGETKQQPLILGSIQGTISKPEDSPDNFIKGEERRKETPGKNEDLKFQENIELGVDISRGFIDPHEEKRSGNPKYSYSSKNDPENHKLSRTQEIKYTFEEKKKLDRTFNIHKAVYRLETPSGDPSWDELLSTRATEYPYLHIHESESGIVEEVDDTPYKERYQQYFGPSLSYEEVGQHHYSKTLGNRIDIQHSPNHKTYILGNVDAFTGMSETKLIGGDEIQEVYGTSSKIVYGNFKVSYLGSTAEQIFGGDLTTFIGNNYDINIINELKQQVGSNARVVFRGTLDEIHWMRDRLWNEGNVHRLRKRDLYDKVNQKAHFIINDGRYTLVSKGEEHLTINKHYKLHVGASDKGNFHELITGEKRTHIKAAHHEVIEKDDTKQVIQNKNVSIGGDYNDAVLGKRATKIAQDKILQVKNWFYQKIKDVLLHAESAWFNILTIKQLTTTYEAYIKAKRILSENSAEHSKNDYSLNIGGDYHVFVSGNLVFDVKGRILIKTESDYVLSAKGESMIASDAILNVGSKIKTKVFLPEHINAPVSAPNITANIIDLSYLASLTPPECPEVDVSQPDYPEQALLPEKPKMAENEYV